MSIRTDDNWKARGACRDNPALFQSAVLDFDPKTFAECMACGKDLNSTGTTHASVAAARDCPSSVLDDTGSLILDAPVLSEFAALPAVDIAALTTEKTRIENAAVNACMGCPVLFQCDTWALAEPVYGVAGGRTESERRTIREGRGVKDTAGADEHAAVACGDRGLRNQIDDAAVARMTAQGRDSKSIARELDCAERTVVRARARVKARATNLTETPQPDFAAVPAPPVLDLTLANLDITTMAVVGVRFIAADIAADMAATEQNSTPNRRSTDKARPIPGVRTAKPVRLSKVSPAMHAIYSLLADGQWHHRDLLLHAGLGCSTDEQALNNWTTNHSNVINGERVIQTQHLNIARDERIRSGARDYVGNVLSASARKNHTLRGGPDGTDLNLYRMSDLAFAAHHDSLAVKSQFVTAS